nr:helix-turn-helix transcriptional regulator [uncultured Acetatifactor sp.]
MKDHHFSTGTLDALRKNRSVTVNTIAALCMILDCTPNDIIKEYCPRCSRLIEKERIDELYRCIEQWEREE